MLKKFIVLLISLITMSSIVYADDSYTILTNVSKSLLKALAWCGYATSMGVLIFIGIKYVMSGANEKANLKGTFPKYLIGVCLILLCSTVAHAVATVASSTGPDTPGEIIYSAIEIATGKGNDKGDIRGDGKINVKDVMILDKYLKGELSEEEANKYQMDLNLDGVVNETDRTVLVRHLAGFKGYEELPYMGEVK